jgi:hypothetical protein
MLYAKYCSGHRIGLTFQKKHIAESTLLFRVHLAMQVGAGRSNVSSLISHLAVGQEPAEVQDPPNLLLCRAKE